MSPRLVAVVGPTCVGKTRLAVALARRLGHAELLNADSRQVLRGLSVGTSAPSAEDLGGTVCHLCGFVAAGTPFTVAGWLREARRVLADVQRRGATPIVVGGTGLYVKALLDGFDLARVPPDPLVRQQRFARAASAGGLEALARDLAARDPDAAAAVDLQNPRRVVRALEIVDARGAALGPRSAGQAVEAEWIGLDVDRVTHAQWVGERTRRMFTSGALQAEVETALRAGVPADALRRCGIGYREALLLREGAMPVEQAIADTVRRTLHYAKAQRTWFRAERRIHWLDADRRVVDLAEQAMAALPVPIRPDAPQAGVAEQTFAHSADACYSPAHQTGGGNRRNGK